MISKVDNGIGSVTNFLKWVLLDLGQAEGKSSEVAPTMMVST